MGARGGGLLVGKRIAIIEGPRRTLAPLAALFEHAGAEVVLEDSFDGAIRAMNNGPGRGRPIDLLVFDGSFARGASRDGKALPLTCKSIGVCESAAEFDGCELPGAAMLSERTPPAFAVRLAEMLLADPVAAYARARLLSPREEAVLRGAVLGLDLSQTGQGLSCSAETVRTYWKRIFQKTGQRTQREVLAAVVRHGTPVDSGPFSTATRNEEAATPSESAA